MFYRRTVGWVKQYPLSNRYRSLDYGNATASSGVLVVFRNILFTPYGNSRLCIGSGDISV